MIKWRKGNYGVSYGMAGKVAVFEMQSKGDKHVLRCTLPYFQTRKELDSEEAVHAEADVLWADWLRAAGVTQ